MLPRSRTGWCLPVVARAEPPCDPIAAQDRCDGTWVAYWGTACETDGGLFVGYLAVLIIFFGAVGVVADIFMGSIENITASEKTVR